MALVALAAFAAYLRDPSLATGSEATLLQQHLDAAHEVVAAHVGKHGARTVSCRASGRNLVLPLTHIQEVTSTRAPDGTEVAPVLAECNLLAGIVVVPTPRPGQWQVDIVTREAAAATVLAVQIIGEHLWSIRRGSSGGAARTGFGRGGAPGDGDVVTTGLGYAVPRRAAQLLGVEGVPVTA